MPGARVYIDGFNLYYCLLKKLNPDCKWLNLRLLAENILGSNFAVDAVNFYTARVSARADSDAPRKQQIYLNALSAEPKISVHLGRFSVHEVYARLCPFDTAGNKPNFHPQPQQLILSPWADSVRIIKTEEKQSDVNLAAHLLRDGFPGKYDAAVIITNDTDLREPIRIVLEDLKKPVYLLCPAQKIAGGLNFQGNPLFTQYAVKREDLLNAQFPNSVARLNKSPAVKPQEW